jgi:hypothetical protein
MLAYKSHLKPIADRSLTTKYKVLQNVNTKSKNIIDYKKKVGSFQECEEKCSTEFQLDCSRFKYDESTGYCSMYKFNPDISTSNDSKKNHDVYEKLFSLYQIDSWKLGKG